MILFERFTKKGEDLPSTFMIYLITNFSTSVFKELPPTIISNSPDSIISFKFSSIHFNLSPVILKDTDLVSPAFKEILAKSFSSFTGHMSVLTKS